MEIVFWCCLGVIFYSYIIYPIILKLLANFFSKVPTPYNAEATLPNVAVVIAAYNEESCIKERVENLLSLDYPTDKITCFIGSDGSTDKTNEILKGFNDPRLCIHIFEQNSGKANVLNRLVALVEQPIIIFSDANTHFESDALQRLTNHFFDPCIGAVCGELNLFNLGDNDNQDSIYWRYEQFLKEQEAKLDALLGANGAIYAIRADLYSVIPENTIVDDFQIVMNVARGGHRIIYDKLALAHEEIAPNIAEESKRRIRIGTGNYQAFTRLTWALNPLIGWRSFSYISHKVFRWFTPHLMVVAFIANLFLIEQPIYMLLLAGQVLMYMLALWGGVKSAKGKRLSSFIALITFFVSMNLALLKGFYRFMFKNVQGTWQRTSR